MTAPAIGVDLGGTKLLGLAVAGDGTLLAEHRIPTPRGGGAILSALGAMVRELDARVGAASNVGVGAPGLVDRAGRIRVAPNLPGVRDLDVASGLSQLLGGRRVAVENDATCAGWGERTHGAAAGAANALVVTLGTGIGGGVIVEGRLMRGAHGFGGEIGHMVVDPQGPRCGCGRRGCWERFASGSGLGILAREAAHAGQGARIVELAGGDPEAVRGEHVTRAASEGDREAAVVMDRYGWWLATGLANLANAFDPEIIVLGGGMVSAGEVLLEPARRQFTQLLEGYGVRPPIPIVPAALGERAGAFGAAALARELR